MSKQEENKKSSRLTRYSSYLYLAMALLIVCVATASIFALNRSVAELPEYSLPSYSSPALQLPNGSDTSKPGTIPIKPDNPVFGETSDVTDKPDDTPSTQTFFRPVGNARVLKPCSLDALVFSETMQDYRAHTGVDFAAPIGTDVRCFADGTVESIREDAFSGLTVTVSHDRGLVTVYANLALDPTSALCTGQTVQAGEIIGKVGATALAEAADEPHLHFEMMVDNAYVDPMNELPD